MNGVTIIETETLNELFTRLTNLEKTVTETISELKEAKKPYLNSEEVMELVGMGKSWLNENKAKIGYSTLGSHLRFKRKDVEEFIEANYFKIQVKKNRYF